MTILEIRQRLDDIPDDKLVCVYQNKSRGNAWIEDCAKI